MAKTAQPDISVIIPCYNISNYIDDCLHSVLSQKNIKKQEIICVNDGSVDCTGKKLEKYSKKYPKIVKVLGDKNNLGVSKARNYGIDNATGKNIMFLDGDDTIGGVPDRRLDTHYLESFLDVLNTNPNCGMAVGNMLVTSQTNNYPVYNQRFNKLFEKSSDKVVDYNRAIDFLDNRISSCAALYRSDVIRENEIRFLPELTYFEDANFITTYAIASVKKYKIMLKTVPNGSFYMYRRRADSAMTKLSRHSEKFMRRLERTQNRMSYYSNLLFQVRGLLGENSHIYNIVAHRLAQTAKQIREYSVVSDKTSYDVLFDYLPHSCVGCMKNRCGGCENGGELLSSAERARRILLLKQKKR
ncbi:MAG: glycosyltransferase family 2 protein [Rickettsiales bacterium]|jgi:glycosyltransferase involved in cell wall biosynthesis|nr:glycosyltransferase family 2 protein [Rickettsiales bacterium]